MRDATGAVQSMLVLGGNSDLANAVVDLLADGRLERVDLAVRNPDAAAARIGELKEAGIQARALPYDADDPAAHDRLLAEAGEVDVVMVAFGTLGDPYDLHLDTAQAAELATTNFVSAVAATHASARHLANQGHGTLVVFSSVAGVRVRSDNAIYGASKAGLDGFAQGLSDALHDTGAHVMIVRPGFVHTKMTDGMEEAPFATTADKVAKDVVAGLRKQSRVVWSPAILQGVFTGLRPLPTPLWRRLQR